MKDYLKILELTAPATPDEIKKAFRRLAHVHHPDKGGDAEKFKEINEAYQQLKAGNVNQIEQAKQNGWHASPVYYRGYSMTIINGQVLITYY